MTTPFETRPGGALPILLLAWIRRKLLRLRPTPGSATGGVLAATLAATALSNMSNAFGGFEERAAAAPSVDALPHTFPSGLIALSAVLLLGRAFDPSRREPRP